MSQSFTRRSLLGALAGASTTLGSFLSSIIVARILGVEKSGAVAYVVWLAFMITPLLDLGASSVIARFGPELRGRGEPGKAEVLSVLLVRVLLLSVAAGLLTLAVVVALTGFSSTEKQAGSWSDTLALLPILAVTQIFATYFYACLRGAQAFGLLARFSVASLAVQLAGVTAGGLMFGPAGAVGGYAISYLLPAAAALRMVRGRGTPDQDLSRRVLRYAGFSWAANVANAIVWSRIELFFLERYWGAAEVGLFTAALVLVSAVAQGPLLLTTAFLPLFSERLGRNEVAAMARAYEAGLRILALLVFPACLGMVAIMPVLLPLVYGQAFAPAVPAAMVLVSAAALVSTTSIGAHLVSALERSDVTFLCAIVGAALSILAGFLFIPTYGLMGAAIARATIHSLMIVFGLWFISRLGYPVPFSALLRLFGASLISSGVAAICIYIIAPPISLPVAIVLGAAAYVVALRFVRALPSADLAVLVALARSLPFPLAGMASLLIEFVGRGTISTNDSGFRERNIKESL